MEFQAQVKCFRIDLTHSEVERPNHNHVAEGDIGYMKKRFHKKLMSKKVPKRIWNYGLVHQADILNMIARGKTGLADIEEVIGQTTGIL